MIIGGGVEKVEPSAAKRKKHSKRDKKSPKKISNPGGKSEDKNREGIQTVGIIYESR